MARSYSSTAMIFFALFMSMFMTLAVAAPVPVPSSDDTSGTLEKRITHVGRGTWFWPGLGNCGFWDTNNTPVVAIPKAMYDANRASNCNQWVRITNTANGKTAYGITRDSCPSCDWHSLDMAPSLFQKLAPLDQGVARISWNFMKKGWRP